MATVPSGSIVRVSIGGADLIVGNLDPLATRITNQLAGIQPGVSVASISIDTSYPVSSAITDTYQYVATIDLLTSIDFSDASVILPSVTSAAYAATNYWPSSSSVVSVNNRSTGTPSASLPSSAIGGVSSAFSGLNTLIQSIPPLVIGAIVIGIGLIIFVVVKNPPKLKLGR